MNISFVTAALLGCALLSACGSSSAGSSGAAGTNALAGSGEAATASGGTSAAAGGAGPGGVVAGSGGAGTGETMCSPGTTIEGIYAYPEPINNCGFTGKGLLAGVSAYYRSIKLDAPLAPGETYAFSVDMKTGSGKMELWGGSAECGDALELLATHDAGTGIRCMTASPKTGTYNYLIWVWYTGGTHGDVTLCPNGSCG